MRKALFTQLINTLLILGLSLGTSFAQSGAEDIANDNEYKDFVHQSSVDQANEACGSMEGYCGPGASHNTTNDIINQFAIKAFGILTGGVLNGIWGADHNAGEGIRTDAGKVISDKKIARQQGKISKKIGKLEKEKNDLSFKVGSAQEDEKADKSISKLKEQKEKIAKKPQVDIGKICQYITMAGTMGLTLADMLRESKIREDYFAQPDEMKQSEALYSVANIHEGKRKDNNIQGGIFSAMAACYAAAVVQASAPPTNPHKIVKYGVYGGLSATLAGLSFKSAKQHRDVRDRALSAARSIPKRGTCHPKTPCFCAEQAESSKEHHSYEYESFCTPKELARGDTRNIASVCIDRNGKTDASCNCLKTNSCFNTKFSQYVKTLNVSPQMKEQLNNSVALISRGNLSEDNLASLRNTGIYFSNQAGKISDKVIKSSNVSLSDDEKKAAAIFKKGGLSSASAVAASKIKINSSAMKRAKKFYKSQYAVKSFKRSNSSKRRTANANSSARQIDPFQFDPSQLFNEIKNVRSPASNHNKIQIERAQNRALEYAEINPFDHKPIFEIISARYLKSAITTD